MENFIFCAVTKRKFCERVKTHLFMKKIPIKHRFLQFEISLPEVSIQKETVTFQNFEGHDHWDRHCTKNEVFFFIYV